MAEHPLYDTPYGKVTQFERKLAEAGLDTSMIDAINKKRGLAKAWVEDLRQRLNPTSVASTTLTSGRFDRYKPHLLAIEDQLNLLEVMDANTLGGQIKQSGWFEGVDTASDHVQSVDDLEILYVEFGSIEGNIEAYWRLIKANQPRNWRYDGLKTDAEHLRLGPNARQYEPGIHRIHINLAAHWESEDGRSVLQVRERPATSGKFLAHAETLAAYGLHDELLRQQDGVNLPYDDLAGYEATVSGNDPWTNVPYLNWNRNDRKVNLNANWAENVNNNWAAPVVWDCSFG